MLRYTETANRIVAFFTDAEIRDDAQVVEAGNGLFELRDLASSTGKRLTLSLRGIQFMRSAMLGSLVLINKSAKAVGVKFRLANVEPCVMESLKSVHLHKVLRFERVEDAQELREASIPVPLPRKETAPCPHCGKPLRTKLAKQCLECGADWH